MAGGSLITSWPVSLSGFTPGRMSEWRRYWEAHKFRMWSPIQDKVGGKPSILLLLDGLVLQGGWDSWDPRGCRKRQGKFCPYGKFQVGHMPIAHLVDHFTQQCGSLTTALEAFRWKSLDKSQLGLWSSSFPGPGSDSSLQFPGSSFSPFIPGKYFQAPPLQMGTK